MTGRRGKQKRVVASRTVRHCSRADRLIDSDMHPPRAHLLRPRLLARGLAVCLAASIWACSESTPTEQPGETNGPPTVTLSKNDGDEQFGAPGTSVVVRPSVRVVDSVGSARSGITVKCAVTSGGGTVTGADAISDASGIARVGSWTLGPSSAVNSLTATAA